MTTPTISPTVRVALDLIEAQGVASADCVQGLNALLSTKASGDSHQLERLLILAGEFLCLAENLLTDPDRPHQEVTAGIVMLQCALVSGRSIADTLGVDHE